MRGLEFAWLIFGYDEKKRAIVGTSFKDGEGALNKLNYNMMTPKFSGVISKELSS